MIIGNFTYDKSLDSYTGDLRTLTLSRDNIVLRPIESKSEKGPSYRVLLAGVTEIGAAWKKTSEQGRNYLSLSLDDPAFEYPLHAALMPSENGPDAILIWSRSKREKTAE